MRTQAMSSPEIFQYKSHTGEGFLDDNPYRPRQTISSTRYRDTVPYNLQGAPKTDYQDYISASYYSSVRTSDYLDEPTSWIQPLDMPKVDSQHSESYTVFAARNNSEYRQPRNDCTVDGLDWDHGLQQKSRFAYPPLLSSRNFAQDPDQMDGSTVSSMSEIHPPTMLANHHLEHLTYPNISGHYHFSSQTPIVNSLERAVHSPYGLLGTQSPEPPHSLSPSNRTDMCAKLTPEPTSTTVRPTTSALIIDIEESDEEKATASEPYAQLIYRALMSVPEHKMVLREIYEWFEKNTDKASSSTKGWQNSIRHNLSMNGVSIGHFL